MNKYDGSHQSLSEELRSLFVEAIYKADLSTLIHSKVEGLVQKLVLEVAEAMLDDTEVREAIKQQLLNTLYGRLSDTIRTKIV